MQGGLDIIGSVTKELDAVFDVGDGGRLFEFANSDGASGIKTALGDPGDDCGEVDRFELELEAVDEQESA